MLDHKHLKPTTAIDILLRIREPPERKHSNGKPLTFLSTPEDFALFDVMVNCLKSTVNRRIGDEAKLAHIDYDFESVNDMAVNIKISGFSDKVFLFAEMFLDIVRTCGRQDGFNQSTVLDSLNEAKAEYANSNIEAQDRANNNRTNFLKPHTFHASLMEKVLE